MKTVSVLRDQNLSFFRRKKNSHNWSLSYGDMVTTLLCFFIIFYAIEKQYEKKVNAIKGYGSSDGILTEHKSVDIDTEFEFAIESLQNLPGIQLKRTSSFVDIYFNKTIFFDFGSTQITESGKKALDNVIDRLRNFDNRYRLEIQGHADKTPVKSQKNRWWKNNMELSIMRALSVHSYLASNKLNEENLVVSGYGNLQNINELTDGTSAEEELNRRISLRIQLIK